MRDLIVWEIGIRMPLPWSDWSLRYVLQNELGSIFGDQLPIKSVDVRHHLSTTQLL
jgi:hypothetical protein